MNTIEFQQKLDNSFININTNHLPPLLGMEVKELMEEKARRRALLYIKLMFDVKEELPFQIRIRRKWTVRHERVSRLVDLEGVFAFNGTEFVVSFKGHNDQIWFVDIAAKAATASQSIYIGTIYMEKGLTKKEVTGRFFELLSYGQFFVNR